MRKSFLATIPMVVTFAFSGAALADPGESSDDLYSEHQELERELNTKEGMSLTSNADGHKEITDAAGNRYSFRLTTSTASAGGCTSGKQVCYRDTGEGNESLLVSYASGRAEVARPESHNGSELTEHANRLGYSIVSTSSGVVTVRNKSTNQLHKVRYAASLTKPATPMAAGIRVESDEKIYVRYTDGWEQEIKLTQ